MKKKLLKGACVLLVLCLGFSIAGCQKSDEDDKKKETFKPSEYTLQAKEEYVYEYLGLKFKLSDKIRKDISDKKIAMLDEQSPTDEELKYAGWLLLSQPPGCPGIVTSLPHSAWLWDLSCGSGLFPSRLRNFSPAVSLLNS